MSTIFYLIPTKVICQIKTPSGKKVQYISLLSVSNQNHKRCSTPGGSCSVLVNNKLLSHGVVRL